jgi:hypothetical protein
MSVFNGARQASLLVDRNSSGARQLALNTHSVLFEEPRYAAKQL